MAGGAGPTQVAAPLEAEEVAEEVMEEVVQVAPMDMELSENEKVKEVQVSGKMLRVLRMEEGEKVSYKIVAYQNKKRNVEEVVVAPLGIIAWAVGKGKADKVVVVNGVLVVVPKGHRSCRQYLKVETGGWAAGSLGIGPIASLIPKSPGALGSGTLLANKR
ncbi:hypothetical protein HOY82DRAFT_609898 [Tuber indicum]|nr:hypothetical protein HOY82DRAFT_609898 [Tuber indicum]